MASQNRKKNLELSLEQTGHVCSEQQKMDKSESQRNLSPSEDPNFVSRSLKKKRGSFQISFEQTFLDQHISGFRQITKNFKESCLKNQDGSDLGISSTNNLSQVTSSALTPARLEIGSNPFLEQHEKLQFLKDLETEDKLEEFLLALQASEPRQVANEFVFMGFCAWEEYLKIRRPFQSYQELIEEGQRSGRNFSDLFFDDPRLKYISLKDESSEKYVKKSEIEEKFKIFVGEFFAIILIVIEQYFENPYAIRTKRLFSELPEFSESQLSEQNFKVFSPRKYRK